jgi:hypothetical protein
MGNDDWYNFLHTLVGPIASLCVNVTVTDTFILF